jgi:hypothetical protein
MDYSKVTQCSNILIRVNGQEVYASSRENIVKVSEALTKLGLE